METDIEQPRTFCFVSANDGAIQSCVCVYIYIYIYMYIYIYVYI